MYEALDLLAKARKVPGFIKRRVQRALIDAGFDLYLPFEDRQTLERVILPYFKAQPQYRKALFVGCDWYTRGYRKFFDADHYWTLEIDPALKRYGARNHIVDSLENLERHFTRDSLDLVICNGVFGWGLNEKPAVEQAFEACYLCLRTGGILILGWNDVPERRPFPLEEIRTLRCFRPLIFPPLGTAHLLTNTLHRHVYDFYVK